MPAPSLKLHLERLEDRTLPANQLTANLVNQVLWVEGTNQDDRILVREQNGTLSVDGIRIQSQGQALLSVPRNQMRYVIVQSLAGNDVVNLIIPGQSVTIMARLEGGSGDDILLGGNASDLVYGGPGNDQLYGNGGNDGLYGGQGFDHLFGNAGADRFLWEVGDYLRDMSPSDAVIRFLNGDRAWNESTVMAVDLGLAKLHARTNNTRLLKTANLEMITFLRQGVLEGDPLTVGDNDDEGTLRFSDSLFLRYPDQITETVIHELSHNWDEANENGFIPQFRTISRWTTVNPGRGWTQSTDREWYYYATSTFAWSYGRTSPLEDMATAMEVALGANQSVQDISAKLAILNRWLDSFRTP